MNDGVTEEAITFLERAALLAAIEVDQLSRRDLQKRFDVSRTTIYRSTVDLEEKGLITRTSSGYRVTAQGRGVAAAIDQYRAALRAGDRLEPLLEAIDHPTLLRSLHLFEDAEVLTADPSEPYWLTEWLTDKLAEVDYFRGLDLVMGNPRQFEVSIERAAAGADMESVISRERMAEWGDRTAGRLDEAVSRLGECNAFVGDDLPFPLQIIDDTVVVIGLDDDTGVPAVCAVTDRDEARDWALALYQRYQREAEPLDIDGLAA